MKRKVGFLAFVFMFLLFIEFNVSVKCDNPELEIADFYPCDSLGNFRLHFERNSKIYFNLTIRNLTSDPKNATVQVVVYDDCDVPICKKLFNTIIPSNSSEYYMIIFTIPPYAYVGYGKAYATLFEVFPSIPIGQEGTNFYLKVECTGSTKVTVRYQCGCPVEEAYVRVDNYILTGVTDTDGKVDLGYRVLEPETNHTAYASKDDLSGYALFTTDSYGGACATVTLDGYCSQPPTISIVSPENRTYGRDVPLIFTIDKNGSWIGYSLDGMLNVTISGNTTLSNLDYGNHSVVVYADHYGNIGQSENVSFTVTVPVGGIYIPVNKFKLLAPYIGLTTLLAVAVVTVVYVKKRKRHKEISF